MRKNVILLLAILVVLPLLQSSLAFRIRREICSMPSEGEEDTPRKRWLIFAEQEYSKVADYIVKESNRIYQKIIDEVTTHPDNELKPHIDKLNEFVERVNNMKKMPAEGQMRELITLSNQAMALPDKYSSDEIKNPTSDILRMEKLLEKHGIEEFGVQILRRVLNFNFSIALHTKAEEYIASQATEENQTEQRLVGWNETARKEAKKTDMISEFFALIRKCGMQHVSDA